MKFKTKKLEEFKYTSPQEMYQDNKLKKIMGPLDYQTSMLNSYMKNYDKKTLALELPTGSGKTLIGLLIGEYRRRKNKEKILFLCPTNQLVHQVATQANEKFGLKAIAFSGRQRDYNPKDKSSYLMAESIGVTTYSSFFAKNSFFEDADILIMDDVHSSEDYIIENWSVKINREDREFSQISELLKTIISETDYFYLTTKDTNQAIATWCNLVPMPLLFPKLNEIISVLHSSLQVGTSNYYAFERISENLSECNIYLSNGSILIRPWIAPTLTYGPFASAKQKILMSATLGKSGELERITGLEKIYRLPIVNEWDKKGLGRRFFVFPDLSLGTESQTEIVAQLHKLCKKSVFLVPDSGVAKNVKNFFETILPNTSIFDAKGIEQSKNKFIESEDATVILANRFDGIDFPDSESRLLFILNLPKTTNIQEKFLISRMCALKLYSERIRTRIIQAVGRCSRNAGDYSIVCIMGDTIQNDLIKEEKLRQFPSELRAELNFGLENSMEYTTCDNIVEQACDFLDRSDDWKEAEDYIVELRNSYLDDTDEIANKIAKKLQDSSIYEIKYQYAIWKKDYKVAYDIVQQIIEILNAPSLKGYKSFWSYIAASLAHQMVLRGKVEYRSAGIRDLNIALKNNISIHWLSDLSNKLFEVNNKETEEDFFFYIIDNMEEVFTSIHSLKKLDEIIDSIISDLKSLSGTNFERGHQKLGYMLGYISENPSTSGAPDPYWILNSNLLIVSEDKIYKEDNVDNIKAIPINHVSEARRHEEWIKNNEKRILNGAEIITIFISNSNKIEEEARIYAANIYYVNRNDFIEWAMKATYVIRSAWNKFVDIGDVEWRQSVYEMFLSAEITPRDFINFIKKNKLKDIN